MQGFEADGEEISEEVARMREHVVEHMDLNDDGFIQIVSSFNAKKGRCYIYIDLSLTNKNKIAANQKCLTVLNIS